MKQILKLGFTLAAFAVVSCFCLALVNQITAPVIEQHQRDRANASMRVVFADADSFEEVNDFEPSTDSSITIENMYLAKKGNEVLGAVAQVSGPTYDRATIIVGVNTEGVVTGMRFLAISDSPGFGLQANDPNYKVSNGQTFYEQFAGKKVADGFVAGETFDGVSGATITSRGVAALLSQATYSAGRYLEQYGGAAAGAAPEAAEQPTLFSFEDAVKDIVGQDATVDDVAFDADSPVHNMLVVRKALVENAGSVIAAAVSVRGQTYSENGGTLISVVGSDRTILGVRLISLNDTLNLGQNAAKPSFYNQFAGKSADADFRPGVTYDVISGASITSDCVADMVKVASYEAAALMAENGGAAAPAGSENYALNEHYLME